MRSSAERETGIEFEDHCRTGRCTCGIGSLATRADPEPLAEPHGPEVLEPLTLPGAVGHGFEFSLFGDQQRIEPGCGTECSAHLVHVGVRCEDGAHDDRRPEWHRTGRRLQHGIVGRVEQRDRQRAELEQGVLVGLGIARADVDAELQE